MSTSVIEFIKRKPEVFAFLWRILYAQCVNQSRFLPLPPGWTNGSENLRYMDMADQWVKQTCDRTMTNDTMVANLLQFAISYPISLSYETYTCGSVQWSMFKVTADGVAESAFVRPGQRPDYLYHGSPLSNWHSIIHNGLQVTSNTAWMTSGAVFGKGIYCSDTLMVSESYSTSGSASDHIIGVYETYGATQYKKSPGYFVVPDAKLLMLRYLIWVPEGHNLHSIDAALREMWNRRADARGTASAAGASIRQRRIERETALVIEAGESQDRVTYPPEFPRAAPIVDGIPIKDWGPRSSVVNYLK